MSYANLPAKYVSVAKCTAQEAINCHERLMKAFDIGIPENEDDQHSIFDQEMLNLFQEFTLPQVIAAVNIAIRKFKKRPTIAHMAELLGKEEKERVRHVELMAAKSDRETRPISEMTDQEVVEALVARGNKGIPWPSIETERGAELMRCAARRFVLQMNPRLDYHRHTFFRLRSRELIPINEKIPEPA